jgi:hypothetical protein
MGTGEFPSPRFLATAKSFSKILVKVGNFFNLSEMYNMNYDIYQSYMNKFQ